MPKKLKRGVRVYSLSVLLLLCFSKSGLAIAYYISNSGNDLNPGTIAAPWATIAKVNSMNFQPGDALNFEGGQVFTGNISLDDQDGNDPLNPLLITSYGEGRAIIQSPTGNGFYAHNTQGITLTGLVFDGVSAATSTGVGVQFFLDLPGDIKFRNIQITDVEIKNFGGEGLNIYSSAGLTGYQNLLIDHVLVHDVTKNGIKIYGAIVKTMVGWPHKNFTISNSEVYNVPGSVATTEIEGNGIVVAGVDGAVVQYCAAHDNGQNNTRCGGPGGIWSLECNNVTIQFCESYRNHTMKAGCDALGFDLDGGMTNSILQYNYAHDNDGAGYLLGQYENARDWSNNIVRYNISENDGVLNEGGIGIFKAPSTSMTGAYIYNNTVYVSPKPENENLSAVYFTVWTNNFSNIFFYNNIFISSGSVPLLSIPVGYSGNFNGNLYWPGTGNFSVYDQGVHYTSLDQWRTGTGREILSGVNTGIAADPLLNNVGSGGTVGFGNSLNSLNAYKVSDPTSPAIGAAVDPGVFAPSNGDRDFWGNILSDGAPYDVGASEHSDALPVKLLGFHGQCSGSQNTIAWVTAEEVNVKSFDLLYSPDGTGFRQIASAGPKGSHSAYTCINTSVSADHNYYKLKMTDLDGSVTYSPVLDIRCGEKSMHFSGGPNPFQQSVNVFIESQKEMPASLQLYDALGKIVARKSVLLRQGNNQFFFDGLGSLTAGTYYLQITQQGQTEYLKLIKAGN